MALKEALLSFEAECQRCGLQFTVPIDRFKDKRYVNWLLSTLGIQYTKEGLENIIQNASSQFYKKMAPYIQAAQTCNDCDLRVTDKKVRTNPSLCQRKVCDSLKLTLERQTTLSIDWKSFPKKSIETAEELTSLYLPPYVMATYSSPTEADISALLNLMAHCAPFQVADQTLVEQVRESRNAIMHSGTMRMDTPELNRHLDNCISLLEDKRQLHKNHKCKEAIMKITQIRDADVHVQINLVKATEKDVLVNLDKSNNLKIDKIKQRIESNNCTAEEANNLKKEIKELEENQAKLQVIFEVYNLDTTDVRRRKENCNRLYGDVERYIETGIRKNYEKQIGDERNKSAKLKESEDTLRKTLKINEEQVMDINKCLDEEKNKSAALQQLYQESQRATEKLQQERDKKQHETPLGSLENKLDYLLENHLSPIQKDIKELNHRMTTVEYQNQESAGIRKEDVNEVAASETNARIDKQQLASKEEIRVGDMYSHILQAAQLEFVKPLENTSASIDTGTTLSCELNRPNLQVKWFKNDHQVVRGNSNLQIVSGTHTHQLVFSKLTDWQAGVYTCTCGDVSTNATLTVQDDDDRDSRLLEFDIESAEVVQKAVLKKRSSLQQLKLRRVDLWSLGDQLSDVIRLPQLVKLQLGDDLDGMKLSHKQCQILVQDLRQSPHLRVLTLCEISCTTHGEKSRCVGLDLGGPLRLHHIKLLNLPFTQVVFNPEVLLRCHIRLPDNVGGQVSSLQNLLLGARNLQQFTWYHVSNDDAVSMLVNVLPQLHSLHQLELWDIDFGSVTDIRLSATMDKLESVYLGGCHFERAGLEHLLHQHNLSQRRVKIELHNNTIRGEEDLISKLNK